MIERRFDVVTAEQLASLAAEPLANGAASTMRRVLFRDSYFDTSDDILQRRGVTCRLRIASDDRRTLTLFAGTIDDPTPPVRYDADVASADPRVALSGGTEPARRLIAMVDPRLLEAKLELQVERVERAADKDWRGRPRVRVFYDRIHVRRGASSRAFHQITVRASFDTSAIFKSVCAECEDRGGLRPIAAGTRERAQLLLKWMEREERGSGAALDALVALVLTSGSELALFATGDRLTLPTDRGAGVGVARTLVDRLTRGRASDPRLIGKVSALGPMPPIEVWTATVAHDVDLDAGAGILTWLTPAAAIGRAPDLDPNALAGIAVATRAGLLAVVAETPSAERASRQSMQSMQSTPRRPSHVPDADRTGDAAPHLINSETSILAFIARVLAMAEDLRTPLAERLRYLAIVASNLDEFFMVRVAGIKRSAQEQNEERSADGLTAREQLELIASRVRSLVARHYRCYEACAAEAEAFGGRVVDWNELDAAQREELHRVMRGDLLPGLTPLAMTLSPGHPFPRLRHLSLSLAVVFLDRPGATPHFAQVEIPDDVPRLFAVPGMDAVITAEDLIRANLDLVYPSSVIEQAYAFRVTRGTELDLAEDRSSSLIQAVEDAARHRFDQPVVRLEVERSMPAVLRDVVIRELRLEQGGAALDTADLYEVDGPLDLRCAAELPLRADAALSFASASASDPLDGSVDIWSQIAERDRLCHHPFDAFESTVVRFFREAATDPGVTAIKLTVYRADEDSPIMTALLEAAERGKDVVVFVELKARFDEERNVAWAKRLEAAGGRVVHGLVGLKTHAKVALVVRREGGSLKRYVHAGTGNYNAQTARRYTDLSLLTANEAVTADIQDLFNELTGRSRAPEALSRGCLISPKQLLPALVAKIEREAAHARAGRGGRIRMKVNGLSDTGIIDALTRASRDGVQIELIVRGVCTLRPGVAGFTDTVRILCVMGRFLEHSRLSVFGNAGAPEYYIGSADMRPRNLRRRVELLVPVTDPGCRAQIDDLWRTYWNDAQAWELMPDGEYVRRRGAAGAQESLLEPALATR